MLGVLAVGVRRGGELGVVQRLGAIARAVLRRGDEDSVPLGDGADIGDDVDGCHGLSFLWAWMTVYHRSARGGNRVWGGF